MVRRKKVRNPEAVPAPIETAPEPVVEAVPVTGEGAPRRRRPKSAAVTADSDPPSSAAPTPTAALTAQMGELAVAEAPAEGVPVKKVRKKKPVAAVSELETAVVVETPVETPTETPVAADGGVVKKKRRPKQPAAEAKVPEAPLDNSWDEPEAGYAAPPAAESPSKPKTRTKRVKDPSAVAGVLADANFASENWDDDAGGGGGNESKLGEAKRSGERSVCPWEQTLVVCCAMVTAVSVLGEWLYIQRWCCSRYCSID